ncbi:cytochrome P450 [Kineosporia succinea]|uniref:Cytochrome P450 n=1 Tax=Kineosporia succinea TaxID=84632 RepID=A0ABT9P807_9ACTN|nr:cytochrome P450 [Kineosporia succinea]MDP9828836.1 cytochrome P450 [Kineosporia succinea]
MLTAVETDVDGILRKIFLPAAQRDPHPWFARLRQDHPVLRTGDGLWMFSRYDDVATITRDPALQVKDATWFDAGTPGWRDHPGLRLLLCSMVFRNGSGHQRVRRALAPSFTPARLRNLAAVTRRATSQQLALLDQKPDLHRDFTVPIVQRTACALLGVPADDGPQLYDLVQPMLSLLDPFPGESTVERADTAADTLLPYLADLLESRRRERGPNLASDAAALPDDDALPAIFLGLAAGFDTTLSLLDHLIRSLAAAPALAANIAAHPQAIEAAIHESLRHDPPLHLITRVTARETVIGGARLEAGQEVMALIAAAHRDPSRFTAPDEFDPRRAPADLLAFSGGPHYCLGAQLAKLEASIVIPALLQRFPYLRPGAGARTNQRVTMPGWTSLPAVL